MLLYKLSDGKQNKAATMSGSRFESDTLKRSTRASESDAYDSASESSKTSSTFSYNRSRSRGRPRKGTTTEFRTTSQPRLKRLKSLYNDSYRGLFNSTVNELAWNQSLLTDHSLQESQIGVTIWSSEEKAAFFRALARKGRHDIRGIATDIGTKSESEVHVYSDMLHKAAVDQQTYRTRNKLFNTSSLEAALEVQGDCCAALDLAAEALSALQQNEDEKAEKKKHKDFALLTPRIARWLERRMAIPEGGEEEVKQRVPAVTMFNLMNFLTLSKRFFMNSVDPVDNWRSYTGRKTKSPSIMYTALSDLYALMISVAQRLVQSSLFFAMSRLRAMSTAGHYKPGLHVRRRDVIAAVTILGMKTDSKSFWARAARKCKLRVYEKVRHRQVFGKRYSYAELERILSPGSFSDADRPGIMIKRASAATSQGPSRKESSVSGLEDSNSSDSMSLDGGRSNPSSSSSNEDLSATLNHDSKHENHDDLQDAYAEALDQQASRNEEHRLWEMLGKDPVETKEHVNVKLPQAPFPTRKTEDELCDWRKLVEYAEDWEEHETPVFESKCANDLGSTRDVGSASGLTSSGSGSESLINDVFTEPEHTFICDEDTDNDNVTTHSEAYHAKDHNSGIK